MPDHAYLEIYESRTGACVRGGVAEDWGGEAMIRTKGEAGTGDVVEAVRHIQIKVHAGTV